jgi:hypothetical protein
MEYGKCAQATVCTTCTWSTMLSRHPDGPAGTGTTSTGMRDDAVARTHDVLQPQTGRALELAERRQALFRFPGQTDTRDGDVSHAREGQAAAH